MICNLFLLYRQVSSSCLNESDMGMNLVSSGQIVCRHNTALAYFFSMLSDTETDYVEINLYER